jgi:hypothetical protein
VSIGASIDRKGHLKRGISRILKARAFLDLLAFCGPSPHGHMRVVSGNGREALATFFASHASSFRVPSDCYKMVANRLLGLTRAMPRFQRPEVESVALPRCNESPGHLLSSSSSSSTSSPSMSGERTPISMLMDHISRCPFSHCVIWLHDRILNVLELTAEVGTVKGRDLRLEAR